MSIDQLIVNPHISSSLSIRSDIPVEIKPMVTVKSVFEEVLAVSSNLAEIFRSIPDSSFSDKATNPGGLKATKKNSDDSYYDWQELGFDSQKTYRTAYSSIPDSTGDHVARVAFVNNERCLKVSFKDRLMFKSEQARRDLAQAIFDRGYRIFSEMPMVVKFDERNRPTACLTLSEANILITGPRAEIEEMKCLYEMYTYISPISSRLTFINGINQFGLITRTEMLDPKKVKLANPTFYPWMNGDEVRDYFADFMDSDANVLVLYGPPGTAKTTMIRTACVQLGLSALVCSNTQVSSDPEFVSKLAQQLTGVAPSDPEKGPQPKTVASERYDLVVVEDGDALMQPRTEGNMGLNSILSDTDGLGSEGKYKLVITTNAETIDKIDSALLRPGRCFDRMLFGRLTPAQAGKMRESLGLPPYTFKHDVVLAAAMNPDVSTVKAGDEGNASIVSPRYPVL